MGVTMPAGCKSPRGKDIFTGPHMGKIPAPPAPFAVAPGANITQTIQTVKDVSKVKFEHFTATNVGSKIPMSQGDAHFTAGGGVKSNLLMNECTYPQGSSKVKVGGKKALFHTCMTKHDGANFNIVGKQAVPCCAKVKVAM